MVAKPTRNKKVFVDNKDAAIDIARSVADVAEERAHTKVKKHHAKRPARTDSEHHGRVSAAKSRLNRAKAAVVAETTRAKREKAKLRKKARASSTQDGDGQTNTSHSLRAPSGEKAAENSDGKTKKRVTFG